METRPFLRDIDDVHHYAEMLESTFGLLYEDLSEILAKFPLLTIGMAEIAGTDADEEGAATYQELALMRHMMAMVIREMADRKKRLADRAVGLADVKLDEERS